MKKLSNILTSISTVLFFIFSFSLFASDLPDPEVMAKQYLKDLCTLNEQDFTRKYMLTQADAIDFINVLNKSYADSNEEPSEELLDSLAIRSQVHGLVVKSYRSFKEWQHDNNIDSSNITYHSCEFELEKKRKVPYYAVDDMNIYFSYDTMKYSFSCDDFLYLKTKWVGGEFDGISALDKYFNPIYDEYDYSSDVAVVDTAVAYDYTEEGDYYESSEEVYDMEPQTKKQLKIQKKIDAYNRKIDALYIKQYE